MGKGGKVYDAIVVGGGPGGSAAALRAAKRGMSVLLLEKARHPRFHIGESFLPRATEIFRELGLEARLARLPQVPKHGATFVMGDDDRTSDFWFSPGPRRESAEAINIERAPFDRMLLDAAADAGATVMEDTAVRSIDRLEQDGVALTTSAGAFEARILLDASGQGTLVGRHLGTRQRLSDLERVAYFQHFKGVERRPGRLGGSPIIALCDEGWFWLIPLDAERTSVGVVMSASIARRIGVPADRTLRWAIDRCPYVRTAMAAAQGPESNYVAADFSYVCDPCAGPGYFLVGDAATFVDPIFSTGVCMGMMSGVKAADGAAAILSGAALPEAVQREYAAFVHGSSSTFFRLVRAYYRHGFREMFLNGKGPLGVHSAVLSALAGHVFPRPVFATRWRLELFHRLLAIHERWPLVPRRKPFSLLSAEPSAKPQAETVVPAGSYAGCA